MKRNSPRIPTSYRTDLRVPTESAWSSSELISNKASIVGTGGGGGLEGVGAGADPVLEFAPEFAPALASAAAGGLELLGLGVGWVDWAG